MAAEAPVSVVDAADVGNLVALLVSLPEQPGLDIATDKVPVVVVLVRLEGVRGVVVAPWNPTTSAPQPYSASLPQYSEGSGWK